MSKPSRPGSRDFKIACNAAERFLAAAHDKPYTPLRQVKPKQLRRPVDGKPVVASEHQEQAAVITWWGLQHEIYSLPVFALFAVPNGGARDIVTAAKLKAEGVRAGVPDLFLDVARGPYHGLRIEMKSLNGRESESQHRVGDYLELAGYKFQFCYGAEAAIVAIKEYLG